MEKKIIVDNKAVSVDNTKTTFATLDAIKAPTPTWAKNAFKITVVITTIAAFWVSGTGLIAETFKVEVMLGLKALDGLVLGISRLFGVELKD